MTPNAVQVEAAKNWPPLKLALWRVVTGAELNAPNYVNAYELTDKLYAAALATSADAGEVVGFPTDAELLKLNDECRKMRGGLGMLYRNFAHEVIRRYARASSTLPPPEQALAERVERLEKDLAAQIAGHRETARQSTENLMLVNTAQAKIDEVELRAKKHWQMYRALVDAIIPPGPMCRDCADENGRCPYSGRPCDTDAAVAEQIATWKAKP